MDMEEYEKVKSLNYLQYCDYLQKKYGIGLCDYMTENWNLKPKCKRTKEGLVAHHKYEDHAIMLSTKEFAMKNPFEWQKSENIVYCDYLEHLYLHILICENPSKDKNKNEVVGIGGVTNFIVPELNDVYSGWETKQEWRKILHAKVKNDKNVYLSLVKRFKDYEFKIISAAVDIKYVNLMQDIVTKKYEQTIAGYDDKKIKKEDLEYTMKKLDSLQKEIYESSTESLDYFSRNGISLKKVKKEELEKTQAILIKRLTRSYNSPFGLWTDEKNKAIYDEIKKL